jgi:hypothetical protein
LAKDSSQVKPVANRIVSPKAVIFPQASKAEEWEPIPADTGEERNEKIEMYTPAQYNVIYHLKQLRHIMPDGKQAEELMI